jgi:heat-inducible transcriptional repressor
MTLKPRQEWLLRAVVEEFIASGSPVGSRYLSQTGDLGVAPSTIRNDLSLLEEEGLLAHPHTSAGRVPTDAGYRHYVDAIVHDRREGGARAPATPTAPGRERPHGELDEALRETADALSRVTELLTVVSAPSLTFASVRHVEVLALQPHLVMVVVITSSGRVAKRVFRFAQPVDEGLAEFARDYLNERLNGRRLGSRTIDAVFVSAELSAVERSFLAVIRGAFEAGGTVDADDLLVGGTSRLLETLSAQGAPHLDQLVEVLEERFNQLELLYDALRQDGLYLRIGHEMSRPSLQGCSLVAANYGVANRNLGTVSVLGPTRMDYQRVIRAVRTSADDLSDLLEELW